MDRRWKIPAFLTAAACLAATHGDMPLRQAKWIAAEDRLETLSTQPAPCGTAPGPAALKSYQIGAIAFRTPLLLGGQAARAGLSCASCHAGGRVTKGFQFPGLSGAKGTADVTSSIMSKTRGDGLFNPQPIPDLARDPPKVSRDPASPALGSFLHGLIVEEFDGPEPSAAVLNGLATFVRAQGGTSCDASAVIHVSLDGDLDDLRTALDAAQDQLAQRDAETGWVLLAGARAILGDIHDRFAGPALATPRAELIALDRILQRAQLEARSKGAPDLSDATAAAERLGPILSKAGAQSLYNHQRLAAILAL